jgi:4-amino-4-deoxy-L-arabinose transferase-like glycosyltransferase
LLCLLAATGLLYVWGLGASDWANSFYSAAVQAGSHSWKAFFFGSSDAANFITVDKTPLALWPMDLAARVFGVNAWSILLPQALMGVATVGVLYATVRRSLVALSPRAAAGGALLAGACLATTPVAALMFRFNNPDASLVLLLTLGAYALVRAQERASTRWLVLAAAFVGLGFLAKMLQAFLVVPAFGLVYLVMAPTALRRRLWQLALAALTLLLSAGWWVAIVAAVPAGSRPYIGGSQHNSVLELALGYNGLGRLSGEETGGLGNTNQDAGWTRMFGVELGGQIAWLLPAALVLLVAGMWSTRHLRASSPSAPDLTALEPAAGRRRESDASPAALGSAPVASPMAEAHGARLARALRTAPWPVAAILRVPSAVEPHETVAGRAARTDPPWTGTTYRAAAATEPAPRGTSSLRTDAGLAGFALWGGWLLVTDAVFSLMQGIFHGYYTVALAPAVAALVGMGAAVLWVHAAGGRVGDGRVARLDRADQHAHDEAGPSTRAVPGTGSRAGSPDRRGRTAAGIVLAAVIALTAWWSYRLLGRTSSFEPWLRIPVLAGGLVAAGAFLTGRWLTSQDATDRDPAGQRPTGQDLTGPDLGGHAAGRRLSRRWLTGRVLAFGAALAVAASLAGPAAYAIDTAATPHRGAIPSAGPSAGPGGMRGPGGFPGGMRGGFGGPPGGGARQGGMPQPPNGRFRPPGQNPGTGGAAPGGGGMRGGGMGGPGALLDASTPSAELTTLLKQNAGAYTWAAATVGSNTAAGYQLATGKPIMAIGGFNGTDPAPSLTRFQQYVRAGKIHYFLAGSMARGRGGNSGGSDDAQQITAWVAQTFPARTVGGTTVYDLG